VNPFDAVQLDVAGRAWAADPGEGAAGVDGWLEDVDRFHYTVHHLVFKDDADVVVGDEGDGPSPLGRAGVEDDGSGFRDGNRAARDDAVDFIQGFVGEVSVDDRLSFAARWAGVLRTVERNVFRSGFQGSGQSRNPSLESLTPLGLGLYKFETLGFGR
jgi:hypothetical protein